MLEVDLRNTPPPLEWGVRVDETAIESLAGAWAGSAFPLPEFNYPGTPQVRDEQWWFDYVTLAVSVLACLWPPDGDDVWHVEHGGDWLDDAPGVFAAFTRRITPTGVDLQSFCDMTEQDGCELFAGRGTLQLIPERVQSLRTTARVLQDRWGGSARNLVEEAGRNGAEIVRLLTATIPAFNDRPTTVAGVARFDKLSHLAASIMAAGVGWAAGGFHGCDDFPVYPDYMLPRVFRHYGAMVYDPVLADRVDRQLVIDANTSAEHAIRWATVYCGAVLTRALAEHGTNVSGPALDYRLWSIAVLGPDANQFGEHHRTITLAY